MPRRFIQVHYLTSYPAALLNRDDVGFAKRIPFGGATRTRISSQCQKRHWRTFQGEHGLGGTGVPLSIRSRFTLDHYILRPLIEEGHDKGLAQDVTLALKRILLGEGPKAKKAREGEDESEGGAGQSVQTSQVTILGRPEVDFLLGEARAVCQAKPSGKAIAKTVQDRFSGEARRNLKALRHASGLDAALFGRMTTGDILARGDAAVHVAHAFTVHSEETEPDYFSAVDDLIASGVEEQAGSAHIGSTELTSGLYYGYVVVDVPLLVSNLEGCQQSDWEGADRKLAADLVERLIHLVAKVSPGAKVGSTAPHSWAQCVLAESGFSQPRTLANAFLRPVVLGPDLLANTYQALHEHLAQLDAMYGKSTERRIAGIGAVDQLKDVCEAAPEPLDAIAAWAGEKVTAT